MRLLPEIDDSLRSLLLWSIVAIFLTFNVVVIFFIDINMYIMIAAEDGLCENLTAIFYGIAGIVLFVISLKDCFRKKSFVKQSLPLLLGLFFIFVAGEEVSWGQRFFNLNTPDVLMQENVQQEITIHNLKWFDKNSSWLNQHTVLNLFVLFNGILIPLSYYFFQWIRYISDKINFPVIPLSCAPFFIIGLIHGQTIAKLYPHWAHPEVKEFIFAVGFFLFSISYFRNSNGTI